MGKLIREPLVHFIALGAIVFLLFHFTTRSDEPPDGRIVITPGKIEQLMIGFSRTWHRPPTSQELDGLIEDHIREEVLFREAVAIGLDKDDTIVRRRMRQKLEFLTEDSTAMVAPTQKDLQDWLDKHPDKFRVEPTLAFSQVYFNASRSRGSAFADASSALVRLNGRAPDARTSAIGDATLLPYELPLSRVDEIAKTFGGDFAQQVAKIEPGRWAGPIQSSYGWHLVYVTERREGRSTALAAVRDAVERDWIAAHRQEIVDATYAKLREKYVIVVEDKIPEAGATSSSGGVANAAPRP